MNIIQLIKAQVCQINTEKYNFPIRDRNQTIAIDECCCPDRDKISLENANAPSPGVPEGRDIT